MVFCRHDTKIDGLLLGLDLAARTPGLVLGLIKCSEEQVVAINNMVRRKLCVLWSPRQTVGAGMEAE